MANRIMTLHPEGKEGVNIDTAKYEQIKDSILGVLDGQEPMPFNDLMAAVKSDLDGKFDGSVSWYLTTVKLDLEARGMLRCKRGRGPQLISLAL